MPTEAQKKAIKQYMERQEQIKIRVPKGVKKHIEAYVKRKAQEEPSNPKYNNCRNNPPTPSVNALITWLLQEEMGESFENMKEQ